MDGAEALRSAPAGRLQPAGAGISGRVSASTVAAIEAGARTASLPTLSALLAAAGLELTVDVGVLGADPELRAHLRNAMPTRLHRALGGSGNLHTAPPRGWRQLVRLSSYGPVSLSGPLAAAVWLPGLAFHTKRWGRLPLPGPRDRRSWRLGDSASMQAWLRSLGYPG